MRAQQGELGWGSIESTPTMALSIISFQEILSYLEAVLLCHPEGFHNLPPETFALALYVSPSTFHQ